MEKNTDFQTANGKNVLISERGKKLMKGLLNEFYRSESDGDIENKLLCLKIKIIFKKQSMLSQHKTLKTALTSREEEDGASVSSFTGRNDGDYYRCSKLPADEKKANV
uniref:Uncharacterized protein n=1 Tax=Glossina pallidipes TaxID=7398 RepID=A0A1A9Z0Q5_GLOPL